MHTFVWECASHFVYTLEHASIYVAYWGQDMWFNSKEEITRIRLKKFIRSYRFEYIVCTYISHDVHIFTSSPTRSKDPDVQNQYWFLGGLKIFFILLVHLGRHKVG